MRAFIAIPCPDELKGGMTEIQESIKGMGKMTLVKPENIHLTLKFLAEVDESKIPEIKERLESLPNLQNFEISLRGIGVFPSLNYIRIIWVGVDKGADKITEIHSEIDQRLKELKFKPDKNFHPHLTLARVKFPKKKEEMKEFIQKNFTLPLGSFPAEKIELMQSRLSPKGPEYSSIHEIELR